MQMWDPQLIQTGKPTCVVNLRSFNEACLPSADAQTSGRSMDWCTCPRVLSSIYDDVTIDDAPTKGIKGAPATHMSLRDLGATGVLLLGTTSNVIVLLGFRRTKPDGRWASEGLGPDHFVQGDSENTQRGTLGAQEWWNSEAAEKVKGRGARLGHLPVATFTYQNFDPAQPGYMAFRGGLGEAGKCPWDWAVCGKKVVIRGHMSHAQAVATLQNNRFVQHLKDGCILLCAWGKQHIYVAKNLT